MLTWSRMASTRLAASSMSGPPRSRTMSPTSSAFSSMAAIGLRTSWATLRESRPTVAMRSATTSSSWAARSRFRVPVTSALSRSTSARARRSRSATWPRAKAGSPTRAITMITDGQPGHGGTSAVAAA